MARRVRGDGRGGCVAECCSGSAMGWGNSRGGGPRRGALEETAVVVGGGGPWWRRIKVGRQPRRGSMAQRVRGDGRGSCAAECRGGGALGWGDGHGCTSLGSQGLSWSQGAVFFLTYIGYHARLSSLKSNLKFSTMIHLKEKNQSPLAQEAGGKCICGKAV